MGLWQYLRGTPGPSGFGSASTAEQIASKFGNSIRGKVVLITGGNSGLGLETARVLAGSGAHIVLPCRSEQKAQQAKQTILATCNNPDAKITTLQLELANLASVRQCAQDFNKLGLPLHVLINNAGIMALPKRTLSDVSQELQFSVNHLGHFLLTNLLLDSLKSSGTAQDPARVVILASSAHAAAPKSGIQFQDVTFQKGYSPWAAYGQTKLANVLHAQELNRRLQADNAHVTAVSLHPGVIATNLARHMPTIQQKLFSVFLPFFKSIPQGAATTVWATLSPEFKSRGGVYLSDCNVSPTNHRMAQDEDTAKKLWQLSEDLTALEE